MPLITEDGTGLADADALASLEYHNAYHTARGNTDWTSAPVAAQEAAIRRTSSHMSHSFPWKGYRLRGRSQALAWPRIGVLDAEGNVVPSDEVPEEVRQAHAQVALVELRDPGAMSPSVTSSQQKKVLVEVKGIKWEHVGSGPVGAVRPVLVGVTDTLRGLLLRGGSGVNKPLLRA